MEDKCVFCGKPGEYLLIYKLGSAGTLGLVVCEDHKNMVLKPKKIRPLHIRSEVVHDV